MYALLFLLSGGVLGFAIIYYALGMDPDPMEILYPALLGGILGLRLDYLIQQKREKESTNE